MRWWDRWRRAPKRKPGALARSLSVPTCRQLQGDDKLTIPGRLKRWGYPRELVENELEHSVWLAYGPHVLCWLHHDGDLGWGNVLVHVCVDPEHRGLIYPRTLLVAIEVVAGLMDGQALWVLPPYPVAVGGLMERLGWTPKEGRWYKRLGEVRRDGFHEPTAAAEGQERGQERGGSRGA